MNLCEAFDAGLIKVGDKCMGYLGDPGIITEFEPGENGHANRGTVTIMWSTRNVTTAPIYLDGCAWLDQVEYIGA